MNSSTSVAIRANLQMSSVERNVAGECRFSGPVSCRPFLRSLFTSTLPINSFTGFRVHALSAEGYLFASCISAMTLTSSLGNRISLMPAKKPDRGSHVTLTFSKATRLFSRWGNSGKAPPPRVIHVRLAQRLRGRAWLARLAQSDIRRAANVARNRDVLKSIASAVLYCARQCIALRGDEKSVESPGNASNFLSLLRLLAVHDEELRRHMEILAIRCATYLSPQTQRS